MVIGGLQKLSLIDYPAKVAAVVFTQGCLFRCPYCHNPELVPLKQDSYISEDDVLRFLNGQRNFIDGVCITGGEQTLHHDLPDFIKKIKSMNLLVKLDTNGINPNMVEKMIAADLLDYIAMDVKHRWEKYDCVAHTGNETALENCKKTFYLIQSSGVDHEFRTTVFPAEHAEEDFFTIAGYLLPGEKYYIQDIRYGKNLNKHLDKTKELNVSKIAATLRSKYPRVQVDVR